MFTLDQINDALNKVQSADDFANYIQDLIILGVKGYDTLVSNGSIEYYGVNNFKVATDIQYPTISISAQSNKELFIEFLVMNQQGQTDYNTFCQQAAQCGIAKWRVDIIEMTCTYFDIQDHEIVIEKIKL